MVKATQTVLDLIFLMQISLGKGEGWLIGQIWATLTILLNLEDKNQTNKIRTSSFS